MKIRRDKSGKIRRKNPSDTTATLMLGMILGAIGWIILGQRFVTPAAADALRQQQISAAQGLIGGL